MAQNLLDPNDTFENGLEEMEEQRDDEMEEEDEEMAEMYKKFDHSKANPIFEEEFAIMEYMDIKEIIKKYTLSNEGGLKIQVMNYGATVLSIHTPDKYGYSTDVILGFNTVEEYREKDNCKLGTIIGRTAHCIEEAAFTFQNDEHFLRRNYENHHRDGGVHSFDKVVWKSYINKSTNSLILSYLSKHKEEGYPGNVLARICMTLSDKNELIISMDATCDQPTPIDISQRLFFNLLGHGAGYPGIESHTLTINADTYLMQNIQGVPNGRVKQVHKTYFDMRIPRPFHAALPRIRSGGYDHVFCLNKTYKEPRSVIFAARLEETQSGRYVEIKTDAPALYLNTANDLPEPCDEENEIETQADEPLSTLKCSYGLYGKRNALYYRHGAVTLSPQGYPNSVNIRSFPSCIVKPHETFRRQIIYKFGVMDKVRRHQGEDVKHLIVKNSFGFQKIQYTLNTQEEGRQNRQQ